MVRKGHTIYFHHRYCWRGRWEMSEFAKDYLWFFLIIFMMAASSAGQ